MLKTHRQAHRHTQADTEMHFLGQTMRYNWTTHHHVICFWDIYFKLKLSTLVVTLIWKKMEEKGQWRRVFNNEHAFNDKHQLTNSCEKRDFNHHHTLLIRI